METETIRRSTKLCFFLGIIVLFSTVSLIAANTAFMMTDKIYQGVNVGDISVGGLSKQEAEIAISNSFNERVSVPPIIIKYQDKSWSISAEAINLRIDAAGLAQQAYDVGRRGNILYCLKEKYLTINNGSNVPLKLNYDKDKLYAILTQISATIDTEPKNARLLQYGSGVSVSPETVGHKVDINATLLRITQELDSKIPIRLDLVVHELSPNIVSADFNDIDGIISIYTTQFDPNNNNRLENIVLAARSINGVLVKPGDTVSFNQIVGPRSAKFGYKEAPVFIDGKLVPDLGGGVCQVSSTLYNAVLLADMGIEERAAHFRPPGYVPLGQDATVADDLIDFKFRNTLPFNVYITSEVSDNQVSVYVFGQRNMNRPDIKVIATEKKVIEPNTIIKQDSQLEIGNEIIENAGQKGFVVTTYRLKYIGGKEIGREHLATDEFKPEDKVVRIGTKTPANQVGK